MGGEIMKKLFINVVLLFVFTLALSNALITNAEDNVLTNTTEVSALCSVSNDKITVAVPCDGVEHAYDADTLENKDYCLDQTDNEGCENTIITTTSEPGVQ